MKLFWFLIIFFLTGGLQAVTVSGSGSSVIINNNLKKAEESAKTSALTNSITNYFLKFKADQNSPEVTEEFIKFIKSYRITKREVSQFVITYEVESEVDDIALNDLKYYVNKIVHSVVFSVVRDNVTDENMYTEFKNLLIAELQQYDFDTKYQSEYDIKFPEDIDISEKLTVFANSNAKYFFQFVPENVCSYFDSNYFCKLSLETKVYSKSEEFPSVKAIASGVSKNKEEAVFESFKKAVKNTMIYIKENQLKIAKDSIEERTLTLSVLNFGKFSDVYDFLNTLKKRAVLTNYKLKNYSQVEASFEVTTKFDTEDFIKKIEKIKINGNELVVEKDGDNLIVTFK